MTVMMVGVEEYKLNTYQVTSCIYPSYLHDAAYYIYLTIVSIHRISAKWVSTFWLCTVATGYSLLGGPRTWFRIFMWVRTLGRAGEACCGHLGIFSPVPAGPMIKWP